MRKALNRVGQSTLEYVIVLTAIVAAILFAAIQFLRPSVNRVYSDASQTMNASGTLFTNSIGAGIGLGAATGSSGGTTGGAATGTSAGSLV